MILTSDYVKVCPVCGNDDFRKDYKREELYCNKCGLVLQSAVQYVGLEKIDNVIPYSAPSEARVGVHLKLLDKSMLGRVNNRKSTRYKHNIPNWKLMRKSRSLKRVGYHIYGR